MTQTPLQFGEDRFGLAQTLEQLAAKHNERFWTSGNPDNLTWHMEVTPHDYATTGAPHGSIAYKNLIQYGIVTFSPPQMVEGWEHFSGKILKDVVRSATAILAADDSIEGGVGISSLVSKLLNNLVTVEDGKSPLMPKAVEAYYLAVRATFNAALAEQGNLKRLDNRVLTSAQSYLS